ncbi:hypothetical protein JTB14_008986 [Gonioctena quinquepunctata]|nr:hypothetical protein JTB14_008986 [Gonioctena quinquepunctata]
MLIAVSKKYSTELIPCISDNIEQVFISVKSKSKKIIVGSIYLPPKSDATLYESHSNSVDHILATHPEHELYLFGDYNLPTARWSNDEMGVCVESDINCASHALCETFAFHNLFQINNIPNCHNTLLDLIFTNNRETVPAIAMDNLLPCDAYHPALYVDIQIETSCPTPLSYDNFYYNFKKGNYYNMNIFFNNVNWEDLLSNKTINLAVSALYEVILTGIQLYVPLARYKNPKFSKWYSIELQNLTFEKKKAHKIYKETGSWDDYLHFSQLRTECKRLSRTCYSDFIEETQRRCHKMLKILEFH